MLQATEGRLDQLIDDVIDDGKFVIALVAHTVSLHLL
jgi:hypothetical protein